MLEHPLLLKGEIKVGDKRLQPNFTFRQRNGLNDRRGILVMYLELYLLKS